MKPQYPYKGAYQETQQYSDNAFNYPGGKHGGKDIVPLDKPGGNHWLAPIFPIFGGKTLTVSNTDVDRGKGIKVRTLLSPQFVDYLKSKKSIPVEYFGSVYLDTLYWHCLMVTDLDGTTDQGTPLAITGNTGNVYSGGLPVPSYQKGRPNYPGLHLHLETILTNGVSVFNKDKDYLGRIDPDIILNYSGDKVQFKTQNYKGEFRVIPDKFAATDFEDWKNICKVLDLDPGHIDETIN